MAKEQQILSRKRKPVKRPCHNEQSSKRQAAGKASEAEVESGKSDLLWGRKAVPVIRSTISELERVDLADVDQPCVILYTCIDEMIPEALAWFPEQQLVKAVSNSHLSATDFIYVASSARLLCGLQKLNIFNLDYVDDWTLQLAVWNPVTDSERLLPPLLIRSDYRYFSPGYAFEDGRLQVSIAAGDDDDHFTVHVLVSGNRSFVVYSFKSSVGSWKQGPALEKDSMGDDGFVAGEFVVRMMDLYGYEAETRKWTSIPCPGKAWNDYPIPEEILEEDRGYGYHRTLHPVLYGSRLLMVGVCTLPKIDRRFAVILERKAGSWSILAWTECDKFRTKLCIPDYTLRLARVCGKLLVFPFDAFVAPTAFHLEDKTWLELPERVKELPLQLFCTYDPPSRFSKLQTE